MLVEYLGVGVRSYSMVLVEEATDGDWGELMQSSPLPRCSSPQK